MLADFDVVHARSRIFVTYIAAKEVRHAHGLACPVRYVSAC